MTRTSTEARGARDERTFRRALLAVIGVLVAACGILALAASLQGPRLSSAQVDTAAVVERPGQQLRIFANQAVAQIEPSQVTVDPATPFSVDVTGEVIALTFDAALRYGTEYSVRIDGVTSPYLANRSTLETTFTTGPVEFWMLDRGSPDDVVVRATVGGELSVMHATQGIQSFAYLNGAVVTSTVADDLVSTLNISSLDGLYTERIPIPPQSHLRGLAIDPGRTVLGFQLTPLGAADFEPDTLFTVDLETGRAAQPVHGVDGAPMRVLRWQFLPTGGLLALQTDGMLVHVGANGVASPLGRFRELGAVSPDGARVVVSDVDSTFILDLAGGGRTEFDWDALQGISPLLGSAQLSADGSVVVPAVRVRDSIVTMNLLVVADGTAREVFSVEGGQIVGVTVSANGQYAAVALVPNVREAVSDGYGSEAMSTSVVTAVVDLQTGQEVLRLDGFALQW